MKRPSVALFAVLAVLGACDPGPSRSATTPIIDPYLLALRAMMNAQGCASSDVRGSAWQPTAAERATLSRQVRQLADRLAQAEAIAKAKGLDDRLRRTREELRRRMSAEFNVSCYPNELQALRHAGQAIDAFRDHVTRLTPR